MKKALKHQQQRVSNHFFFFFFHLNFCLLRFTLSIVLFFVSVFFSFPSFSFLILYYFDGYVNIPSADGLVLFYEVDEGNIKNKKPTGIEFKWLSAPISDEFRVDRPFYFVLVHRFDDEDNGIALFHGRYTDCN